MEPDPAEMAAGLKARIFSLRQPGREWYDAALCRFEALRQSRDGSLAAIVVVSAGLGRFHRGAGLFVTACPEIGGMGGKGSHLRGPRPAGRGSGSSFETEEAPVGTPGLPNGRSPWGEGKMIALSALTVTNRPQFLAGGRRR